jgi:hypothetical protein
MDDVFKHMKDIQDQADRLNDSKFAYDTRRRVNPHHP